MGFFFFSVYISKLIKPLMSLIWINYANKLFSAIQSLVKAFFEQKISAQDYLDVRSGIRKSGNSSEKWSWTRNWRRRRPTRVEVVVDVSSVVAAVFDHMNRGLKQSIEKVKKVLSL